MSRPIINFSWNWNGKLFCKCFTTIRLHNPNKYVIGNTYDIQITGKDMGLGVVRAINPFKLSAFKPFVAYLDMGMSVEKCTATILTMYKNKGINWDTQLLDLILIEQADKIMLPLPPELLGRYVDAESPEAMEWLKTD